MDLMAALQASIDRTKGPEKTKSRGEKENRPQKKEA